VPGSHPPDDDIVETLRQHLPEHLQGSLLALVERLRAESYVQAHEVLDLWRPIFRSYKKFIAAVGKAHPRVRNITRGRRRLIHVQDLLPFLRQQKANQDILLKMARAAELMARPGTEKGQAPAQRQAAGW
jgi:hypothetical protein